MLTFYFKAQLLRYATVNHRTELKTTNEKLVIDILIDIRSIDTCIKSNTKINKLVENAPL